MANEKLHFLICSSCQGAGVYEATQCSACGGLGLVSYLAGRFLYWGKKNNRAKRKIFSRPEFTVLAKQFYDPDDISLKMPPIFSWQQINDIQSAKLDISLAFDRQAKKLIAKSLKLAHSLNFAEAEPIHLFLAGILSFKEIKSLIQNSGADPKNLIAHFGQLTAEDEFANGSPIVSIKTLKLLFNAYFQAYLDNRPKVELLDVWKQTWEKDETISAMMLNLGIDLNQLEMTIYQMQQRPPKKISWKQKFKYWLEQKKSKFKTPHLHKYATDLTYLARMGRLNNSPAGANLMGEELAMNLASKSHPAFIIVDSEDNGTLISDLAIKIANQQVVGDLGKHLVSLDLSLLLAGAGLNQARQRFFSCLNEIAQNGNTILYLDNLHDLWLIWGSGLHEEVLEQALKQRLFSLVGSTRSENFDRYLATSTLAPLIKKIEVK